MLNKKILILVSLLLVSFLLVGCFPPPAINQLPIITTEALPDATVGTEYTATVVATDADDDALTFSKVSGPTDMAISEAGVISGWIPDKVGTEAVTVAVTDGTDSVSADFTITVSAAVVVPVAVTGVTLDKATLTLTAGGTLGTLVATVAPTDATDKSVTWVSSAPAVATVALGVVTPLTAGQTAIMVKTVDGGFTDICIVTVSPAPAAEVAVTGVTLNEATLALTAEGATETLVATVAPATATDKSVTWASSASAIATVTAGVVTPLTAGTATITVTTVDGGFTATCAVTVRELEIELTGIVVLPEKMDLIVGEEKTITSVTATYEIRGTEVPIALGDCTYESDDDEVATVLAGVVSAVAEGTATITVDYKGETDTLAVTVSEFVLELVGIEVEPEEMTLSLPGGLITDTCEVTAHYNNDTEEDVTPDCVYGIDDTSIATVVAGTVEALKVGTATISINYTEEGITKETTLAVIVEGTLTIRWLEDAVRYNADGSFLQSWQDNHNPSLDQKFPAPNPATLILTGGGYHFADVQEYFNWDIEYEGDIVIDGTGQLSGYATYTLDELPIQSDFLGQVEIIIGEVITGTTLAEIAIDDDHDGIMVGTYTQLKYAFGTEDAVTAKYPEAIKCEGSEDKWFVQYTYYTAHGQ